MSPETLMTTKEVATRLRVAVSTLKRWRRIRKGPPWCRVEGRTVRYQAKALEDWLAWQPGQADEMGALGAVLPAQGPDTLTGIIHLDSPISPTGAHGWDCQSGPRS